MVELGERKVVARGLTRRFGAKLALQPTDLDAGPGGVTGLLGPNGSGKSTLLRMLVGLVRPDAGQASVDGVALSGDGLSIRKRCTYSPGEIALYGELCGADHLDWFLRGRPRDSRRRARELADAFGLPLRKRVHTYSHGMKRQLMFAAALAPRVGVRILDEASEGLDPSKRSVLIDLLEEDAAQGTTILLSSHHLGEVDRVCDRFVFLNEGKCISVEDADTLQGRARRLVRLSFREEGDTQALEKHLRWLLEHLSSGRADVRGASVVVFLHAPDPRPCLAEIAALRDLPQIESFEYGQTSLQDLYRGLYGVEAC